MSSVDFQKCKGGTAQASAMIRHMERHDGRDVEYANRWVDTSRSHLNTVIDASGTVEGGRVPDSRQTHQRLKERVRLIDEQEPPKRIRKDRVTVVTLTVAAPEGLPEDSEERFFRLVYEEIAKFCGGSENVSAGFIHRDEIHDYIDTDGSRKTSRPHMHMAVVPYVSGVGVNGKAFETRTRMRDLNAAIDQRCREQLHVPFLTGKKGRTGRSVEDLQAMSEDKAVLARKRELLEQITAAQQELEALRGEVLSAQEVRDIEIRKPLFGKDGETRVQYSVLKSLQATAAKVEAVDLKLAMAKEIAGDLAAARKELDSAKAEVIRADRQAADIREQAGRYLKKSQTDAYRAALADKETQELIAQRLRSAKEEAEKIVRDARDAAKDLARQAEAWSTHVSEYREYSTLRYMLQKDPEFKSDYEIAQRDYVARQMGKRTSKEKEKSGKRDRGLSR